MLKLILLGFIFQALAQNLNISNQTQNYSLTNPLFSQLYNTSADGDAQFIQEINSDQLPQNVTEYGYGFWFRFLTTYPSRLLQGKNADFYFLARLTNNRDYNDSGFGDRLLAVWQGQGKYVFTTCNSIDRNPSVYNKTESPQDIEGLWTYLYYSHSQDLNSSVGFILFANQQQSIRIQLNVTHPNISYLKFILAGKQFSYPGFNGQIYNLVYGINANTFVDQQAQFYQLAGLIPNVDLCNFAQFNQINQTQNISVGQGAQQYEVIGGASNAFPQEYSVSGWFKWSGPYVGDWHLAFRLSINDEKNNANGNTLGDRTLSVFLSKNDFFRCSTYSYYDMVGNGNNFYSDIQNQGKIQEWHFIYFGYSRYENKAHLFFQNGETKLTQDYFNIHHYLTEKFYFILRDNSYSNYNGQIDQLNVNLGKGAFLDSSQNYYQIDDVFSYLFGLKNYLVNISNNSTSPNNTISSQA